ncbi:hypothetical protein DY000_02030737 [Brassica cretica]|uniref:Uncharacterized protein n=1 Tax=Brassica cretica TaxID=69181 RepID=A0ABQ7DZT8_BRACR|nr:hypothetical protein DY000_02030737 [Brassica cretica]
MIKWRCCPELVQFYGFISVEVLLDTQPGSPKNCPGAKGGRSPGCDVDTTGPMPYRLDYEYWDNCVECVLCRQQVRNPPMLGMFWGGLVFPRPRTQRVQGNPLFAGSGRLRRTGSCPMAEYYTTDIADREEEHEVTRAQVLILSPKSGLGTGLGLVALGKDDWIAWCWTLGPPV